jgi:hypothetical protein
LLLLIYLLLLLVVQLLLLHLLWQLALILLLLLLLLLLQPALLAVPVKCCHLLLVADHTQRCIGYVKVRPEYVAAVIASGSNTQKAGCRQGGRLDAAP